jgi:hypothetical protein
MYSWIPFAIILLMIFALMFIKEIVLYSFLDVYLSGFGMNVILASQNELGVVFFSFYFVEMFKEGWY